jgi:hypothetical protein
MALSGVLSFASFSIMLVVGVATFDAILFRFRGVEQRRWLALLAAYCVAWLACYLLVFRPAVMLQTLNYPDAYQRLPLEEYWRNPLFLRAHIDAVARSQVAVVASCTLAALAAARLARTRRSPALPRSPLHSEAWQPLRVLVALLGLITVLWLARIYPVSTNRQFLFTTHSAHSSWQMERSWRARGWADRRRRSC